MYLDLLAHFLNEFYSQKKKHDDFFQTPITMKEFPTSEFIL